MLKDTERLMIIEPGGRVFTELGGLEETHKICFPHYTCKDTINDFGFVEDFKIEAVKDRYLFFSAKPMNTALPTFDDIIQVITTEAKELNIVKFSIYNEFIYGNYICIFVITPNTLLSLWLVMTKNTDTDSIVYTFVYNNSDNYIPILEKYIKSKNIYFSLNHICSYSSEARIIDFDLSFIKRLIKDNNMSKTDLIKMYADYKDNQSNIIQSRNYRSSVSHIKICDNFFIIIPDVESRRIAHGYYIYTVIHGLTISFYTHIIKASISEYIKLMDTIGVNALSEIIDEMKNEKSFPVLKNELFIEKDAKWPIKDAYDKGYISIISMEDTYYRYIPERTFIRWNPLSNYKEYEYYKEMDDIIKEEENEINALMKSLGKIRSVESIKRLKNLNTINTIYKL